MGETRTGPPRILRAAERTAAPWSNGGGVTREVAVHPPGSGWDAFDWRVSLAEVTRDGPYSPLSGVQRILTVVEGAGTELTVDGRTHLLTGRFRPFTLPGDAVTEGRLPAGPIVNLNVMLRDGRAAATVEMVRGRRSVPAVPGNGPDVGGGLVGLVILVVALEGGTRLVGAAEPVRLERFDAALLTGEGADGSGPHPAPQWELHTDGVAALITMAPAGQL
ncbi:HutD family protein [Streptomyces sp. NPDC017993]|uniref:HutD family protein n=1 Tax=Streptomyces sp. NPDC017993 TaxID=3365027 RepID=UPI003793EE26